MQDDPAHKGIAQLLAQEPKPFEIVALNAAGSSQNDDVSGRKSSIRHAEIPTSSA